MYVHVIGSWFVFIWEHFILLDVLWTQFDNYGSSGRSSATSGGTTRDPTTLIYRNWTGVQLRFFSNTDNFNASRKWIRSKTRTLELSKLDTYEYASACQPFCCFLVCLTPFLRYYLMSQIGYCTIFDTISYFFKLNCKL